MNNKITIGYLEMYEKDGVYYENYMGDIGSANKKGKDILRIDVYTNDGENTPHFHYSSPDDEKDKSVRIDGCCELFKARYFIHSDKHPDKLRNSLCKLLDKWMRKAHSKNKSITNWDKCVEVWMSHSKHREANYLQPKEQPDYKLLNEEDMYYRVTDSNGVGIYEAVKRAAGSYWKSFKANKKINWLPTPKIEEYKSNYRSYFTEYGYNKFIKDTYKHVLEFIDEDDIELEEISRIKGKIIYDDDYQIVVEEK